ncbi:MAG: phosphatase PAP2 family protein, partial [Actinomycetes bacterium]
MTTVVAAEALGMPIRDPEGFLGPSWLRFPLLCLGAFLADVLPRAVWRARKAPRQFLPQAKSIVHEHWNKDRITLVVIGLGCFYVTYVSYRNLKSFLPFIREGTQDRLLHEFDKMLLLGNEPAILLHSVFGSGIAAHVLSFVYLFFLLFVPLSLVGWLVWSRNISFGYWYVTALNLCWTLGVVSYYAIPSLGPGFESPWLYSELATTPTAALQGSLTYS